MAKQNIGKLFLLASPSGGGKTTLAQEVIKQVRTQREISRVITYTTRAQRVTDKPGVDYHFVPEHDFLKKIEQRFFLEWSNAYGHYYGTPGDIVQQVSQGAAFIAVVDRTGVQSIKGMYESAVAIWLDVPHIDVLEKRLRARATESEEQIQRRLRIAQQELEQEAQNILYSYRVMNDQFNKARSELINIVRKELALIKS